MVEQHQSHHINLVSDYLSELRPLRVRSIHCISVLDEQKDAAICSYLKASHSRIQVSVKQTHSLCLGRIVVFIRPSSSNSGAMTDGVMSCVQHCGCQCLGFLAHGSDEKCYAAYSLISGTQPWLCHDKPTTNTPISIISEWSSYFILFFRSLPTAQDSPPCHLPR